MNCDTDSLRKTHGQSSVNSYTPLETREEGSISVVQIMGVVSIEIARD